jgi:fatty-acyl-CoA synthase
VQPQTLMRALTEAAGRWPGRGITVQPNRRTSERRCYPDVLAATERAAGLLTAAGVRPGERVMLALPTSWPLIEFWFGAVLCGALPIAAAPPLPFVDAAMAIVRLEAIARHFGISLLIMGDARPQIDVRSLAVASLYRMTGERPSAPLADAEDIAFLQLTSGTERIPRAAAISHRALLHNTRALHAACGGATDRVVSWLPLHHDMGLVGSLLLSIITGSELVLIAPPLFLAWPDLWFAHIAESGTVLSLAPNFALQLCLDRRDRIYTGHNLSGWHALICGGEMVRASTLEGFALAFDLPAEAMRPGYGLAEATLAVTLAPGAAVPKTRPAPAHSARQFVLEETVCAGPPLPDMEVAISNAGDGGRLPPGQQGEVLVRGPGLFSGYLDDPTATAEALASGWLRTGDLGFLEDGELYLTGRLRETLNLRGIVTSPHELEWIAETLTGGGGRCRAAAFSVAAAAGGERAVLAVEVETADPDTLAAMGTAIRARVSLALGLQLGDLVLLRRGQLPRTTSGKVRRAAARDRYLDGRLEPAA